MRSVSSAIARSTWVGLGWVVQAALGLAAESPAAAPPSPFGINIHAPRGAALEPLLGAVSEAGLGWVRIDVVWAEIESRPGHYDWSTIDGIVAAARRRGLGVLGILAYTPAWATDGAPVSGVPRAGSGWPEFCRLAAQRYAGAVAAWELWNEPNLEWFWGGSRRQWIDDILLPGAAAVREADPAARVVGPALSHHPGGDWARWLYDVLREADGTFDVVSHHVYAGSEEGVTSRLVERSRYATEPSLWGLASPSLREVLDLAGWRGPVWLTETGWQGRGAAEPFQAAKYGAFLGEWFAGRRGRDWIERVFFYELQDGGPTAWGILRADRSRKLAWGVYRDFIRRRPSSPPPDDGPGPRLVPPRIDKTPRRGHSRDGS